MTTKNILIKLYHHIGKASDYRSKYESHIKPNPNSISVLHYSNTISGLWVFFGAWSFAMFFLPCIGDRLATPTGSVIWTTPQYLMLGLGWDVFRVFFEHNIPIAAHTHLKPQMISREAKREAKRGYCRENYPTSVPVFQALLLAFVQVNLPSLDVASLLGDVVESHQRDHAMPHASDAWRCS